MAERVSSSKVRDEFSDMLNRVLYQGARIVLNRRGKNIAALVPIEDFEVLEALENRKDIEDFRTAKEEKSDDVAWEDLKREAGME